MCARKHTGPGGDSVYNLPIKADVDGKNQGMELVVLTSTLLTFLLSRVPYQGTAVPFLSNVLWNRTPHLPELLSHGWDKGSFPLLKWQSSCPHFAP